MPRVLIQNIGVPYQLAMKILGMLLKHVEIWVMQAIYIARASSFANGWLMTIPRIAIGNATWQEMTLKPIGFG